MGALIVIVVHFGYALTGHRVRVACWCRIRPGNRLERLAEKSKKLLDTLLKLCSLCGQQKIEQHKSAEHFGIKNEHNGSKSDIKSNFFRQLVVALQPGLHRRKRISLNEP